MAYFLLGSATGDCELRSLTASPDILETVVDSRQRVQAGNTSIPGLTWRLAASDVLIPSPAEQAWQSLA